MTAEALQTSILLPWTNSSHGTQRYRRTVWRISGKAKRQSPILIVSTVILIFWLTSYCVGTADSITVSRSPVPTPTPTGTFVMPTPNQANNAISNCNKAAQAKDGEFCSVSLFQWCVKGKWTNMLLQLFAEHNKISTTQLYAWNSVLDNGKACDTAFWKDYW